MMIIAVYFNLPFGSLIDIVVQIFWDNVRSASIIYREGNPRKISCRNRRWACIGEADVCPACWIECWDDSISRIDISIRACYGECDFIFLIILEICRILLNSVCFKKPRIIARIDSENHRRVIGISDCCSYYDTRISHSKIYSDDW